MFRITTARSLGFAVAGFLFLSSCGGSDRATGVGPTVATIQVTPGADTLVSLGDTRQLTALPLDANGDPVTGVTLSWTSSAPSVLAVNANTGVVSAVANGQATISAKVGSITGTATLLVAQEVATVTVSPATANLSTVNGTQQFSAAAKDANNNPVAGVKFLWLSSDQSVATVDTTGKATSRGAGSATVTAAAKGIPGNAVLSVTQVATQLAFTVSPPNGVTAGDPFPTAVEVELRDAGGTLVAGGARTPVTVSVQGDTLHGTTTVNTIGGVASFPGLWINKAGTWSLKASAPGLAAQATSQPFTEPPGPPINIGLSAAPARSHAGDLLPAVVVAGRDRVGNLVSSAFSADATLFLPPPGAQLNGTTTVAANGGLASFADLAIDSVGRHFVLSLTTSFGSLFTSQFVVAPRFRTLDVGNLFSCGLAARGQALCWGYDFYGQSGHGVGPQVQTLPIGLPLNGDSLEQISAGGFHACAVDQFGVVYCWGRGDAGQSGTGCFAQQGCLPEAIGLPGPMAGVAAGLTQSCSWDALGAVYCWGRNSRGSLGSGDTTTASPVPPTQVTGGQSLGQLSLSKYEYPLSIAGRACGLSGGAAYCWGDNTSGQLGIGSADTLPHATPVAVTGGLVFKSVSVGATVCGVEQSGALYCWGWNGEGELGIGSADTLPHPTPTQVPGLTGVASVSVGQGHVCAHTLTQSVFCWGANFSNQLGTGDFLPRFSPTPVPNAPASLLLSVGPITTCWLSTASHDVVCMGGNSEGEIGDGTTTPRASPTLVFP